MRTSETTITREEAARRLGVSFPTLKKRTLSGEYTTVKKDGDKRVYYLDYEIPDKSVQLPFPRTIEEMMNEELPNKLEGKKKEMREFMVALNMNPPEHWIKTRVITTVQGDKVISYLPIERIEYMLFRIFTRWRVKILKTDLAMNSILMTVRVKVLNPITEEWDSYDGTGAAQIPAIYDSMDGATAKAKARAFKNACKPIGKIFGKDLSREDEIDYAPLLNPKKKQGRESPEELRGKENERLLGLIARAKDLEGLEKLKKSVEQSTERIKDAFEEKKEYFESKIEGYHPSPI